MPSDAIVFDDDEALAGLAAMMLEEKGFSAEVRNNGRDALNFIKASGARLVILDIMMPGADGISILRSLRADPATRSLKVAVASSKIFDAEKKRAMDAGADLFVAKPYKRDVFFAEVTPLLGSAPKSRKTEKILEGDMAVQALGAWGPGGDAARKTCSVVARAGKLVFLFDAGTGLVDLPKEELSSAEQVFLFLTHACRQEVQGLELLKAAGLKEKLFVYAPDEMVPFLKSALPPETRILPAFEDAYELGSGAKLTVIYAHHPGAVMAYSLEVAGRKIVYAPKNELPKDLKSHMDKMRALSQGASLIIHDAFNPAGPARRKEGYASAEEALDLALSAGAERLMLFTHDPSRQEAEFAQDDAAARKKLESEVTGLEVFAGKDSAKLDV